MKEIGLKNIRWLGGFFDGAGNCNYQDNSPRIEFSGMNPISAQRCHSILKVYGIVSKLPDKVYPGKSSKIRKWSLLIKDKEAIKFSITMFQFVFGKKNQLQLIQEEKNRHQKLMQYSNKTNNFLILKDDTLWDSLGFVIEKKHENATEENKVIKTGDFNDICYLAGIFDAIGIASIQQRNVHHDSDVFTPQIEIESANKAIIENCFSTLKNNHVGCHVSSHESETSNRARWKIKVSGVRRIYTLSHLLMEESYICRQQLEVLFYYCKDILRTKKPVNDTGFACKMSLETLNKQN